MSSKILTVKLSKKQITKSRKLIDQLLAAGFTLKVVR